MSESEWLSSTDPQAMLQQFRLPGGRSFASSHPPVNHFPISDRKLRLFACAVARHHIAQAGSSALHSIEVAERAVEAGYPDHNFDDQSSRLVHHWWAVCRSAEAAQLMAHHYPGATVAALLRCQIGNPFRPVTLPPCCVKCGCEEYEPEVEYAACARCAGDMKGRRGITPQVLSLATAAYEQRGRGWSGMVETEMGPEYQTGTIEDGSLDPFRLALLADALEEAGCDNAELLRHLRGEELVPSPHMPKLGLWQPMQGPHFRGCHALDLILGKS